MRSIRFLRKQPFCWISLGLAVCLGWIPVNIAIAHVLAPQPQAILMLGGGGEREEFTAYFAKDYPTLDVWISSGKEPIMIKGIFAAAKTPIENRLHLDYRAKDTVTNFTTLVAPFKQRQIRHVFLITSAYHMPRAKTIATVIFGSQGIVVSPIAIPSTEPRESTWRIGRDAARSILWILTGRTGASLNSER